MNKYGKPIRILTAMHTIIWFMYGTKTFNESWDAINHHWRMNRSWKNRTAWEKKKTEVGK